MLTGRSSKYNNTHSYLKNKIKTIPGLDLLSKVQSHRVSVIHLLFQTRQALLASRGVEFHSTKQ